MNPHIDKVMKSPRGERLVTFLKNLPGSRKWTEQQIRAILSARGYCEYCGGDLLSSDVAFWASQWDHIIPAKHAGQLCYESNVAFVCSKCNSLKGSDLPQSDLSPDETVKAMMNQDRQGHVESYKVLLKKRRQDDDVKEVFEGFRTLVDMIRSETNKLEE